MWREDSLFNLQTVFFLSAISVELDHFTLYESVFNHSFARYLFAETLFESIGLLVDHILAYFDGVVWNLHTLVEFDFKFRSKTEFELEVKFSVFCEVNLSVFRNHWFAENVEFVLNDIIAQCTAHLAFYNLCENIGTEHFLQ